MDGPGFLRHCSTVSIPFVDNISPPNTYQKYNSHKLESDSTVRKIVLCETLISLKVIRKYLALTQDCISHYIV